MRTFAEPESFFEAAPGLEVKLGVFVDAHLANEVRGEAVSRQISEMGFPAVYLATNYSAGDFGPMPWIAGVRGKYPPW